VITGTLGLILVAAGLLLGGLTVGSNRLLGGSVVVSLLAAVLLVVGSRRAARRQSSLDDSAESISQNAQERQRRPQLVGSRVAGTGSIASFDPVTNRYEPKRAARHEPPQDEWVGGTAEQDDPPDEPLIERRPARVAALVARLDAEVFVTDGRPRYHMIGCPSLSGRGAEPLSVGEANDLGFSPCGLCQPDATVAGGATATP
jgi:hypothetical protein